MLKSYILVEGHSIPLTKRFSELFINPLHKMIRDLLKVFTANYLLQFSPFPFIIFSHNPINNIYIYIYIYTEPHKDHSHSIHNPYS